MELTCAPIFLKGLGDISTELAGGPEEKDSGDQHGQVGTDDSQQERDHDEELKLLA